MVGDNGAIPRTSLAQFCENDQQVEFNCCLNAEPVYAPLMAAFLNILKMNLPSNIVYQHGFFEPMLHTYTVSLDSVLPFL